MYVCRYVGMYACMYMYVCLHVCMYVRMVHSAILGFLTVRFRIFLRLKV